MGNAGRRGRLAKIKNQRKDELHQFSSALVKNNAAIFVGDVASARLVKTRMARSVLDAGWPMSAAAGAAIDESTADAAASCRQPTGNDVAGDNARYRLQHVRAAQIQRSICQR